MKLFLVRFRFIRPRALFIGQNQSILIYENKSPVRH